MSGDERLTELLRTASGALGGDLRTDPRALLSRARSRRRLRQRIMGVSAVAAVLLLGGLVVPRSLARDGGVDVATGGANREPEPVWSQPPEPGWTRLPDPPLSPRDDATAVVAGNDILVLGGSQLPCSAGSACDRPAQTHVLDGAAFSLDTRTWRLIAPSPFALVGGSAAVVDGDAFKFAPCLDLCPGRSAVLRYRPTQDAWDVLAPPPTGQSYGLVRFKDGLIAYDTAENVPERTDWRLDIGSGLWTKLPPDPLPPVFGRVMTAAGDDLLLFAVEPAAEPPRSNPLLGARLDVADGKWRDLPPAPGTGFGNLGFAGVAISGSSDPPGSDLRLPSGGIFDPESDAWLPLPSEGWPPPAAVASVVTSVSGVAGVLRATTATFAPWSGAVLDIEGRRWIDLPPVDDRENPTVTAVGRRLFQYGGTRQGQRLNEAWVWTPPPAAGIPGPTPPVPTSAPPEVPSTTAPVATPAPPTSAAPTAGAPQFLSASGDASAGRVTVRFDRPVTGDPPIITPGGGINPPDKTTPMNLIVFGSDQACTNPEGNGHEYLEGLGTDTITTDATTLVAGTTYIGIGAGFVKSAADGTFNGTVKVQGAAPSAFFSGMSCIPIPVS